MVRQSSSLYKGGRRPSRDHRSSYSDDYRVTPELSKQDTSCCSGSCCPSLIQEDLSRSSSSRYKAVSPSRRQYSSSGRSNYASQSSPRRHSSPSKYSSSQLYSSSRYSSPVRHSYSPSRTSHSPRRYSRYSSYASPQRSTGSCSTCCSTCFDRSRSPSLSGSSNRSPARTLLSCCDDHGSPSRTSPRRSRQDCCSQSSSPDRRTTRQLRRGSRQRESHDFGNLCEEHIRMLKSQSRRDGAPLLGSTSKLGRDAYSRSRDYHHNKENISGEKLQSFRGRSPVRGSSRRCTSRSISRGRNVECKDCAPKYADRRLRDPQCCVDAKIDCSNVVTSASKLGDRYSYSSKKSDPLDHIYSNHDILSHMVTQTKAQKKQIRSLENEVERLRGCDVLAQCEVRQRDVDWRPGDVLGEGSFSTVYRGTFCGIDVAVKELKLKLSQDDKNYFRSEAALLQQLHHPRVVLLMGVCSTGTRPFMLLEYMCGGSLHALLHSDGKPVPLDHATYFCIARDVAQGVNYLHKHDPQVLHLDLKSMNVLLDGYTRAKIADFGFSILRRSRSPAQKGAIRGTPAWMAPELLTKGEVSAKCDVYSYAIILWEMLTSEQPFKGYDVLQILESVEAGVRPPLPNAHVSRELRELITSCWAQNAALRPSFAEVLGALEEASVPPSWRGLFQRAQLPTSLPQDPPLARTVINAVQESVETLRRNKKNTERNSRNALIREVSKASGLMSSEHKNAPPKPPVHRSEINRDKSNAASKSQDHNESRIEKVRSRDGSSLRGKKGRRERSKARGQSSDIVERKKKYGENGKERASPTRSNRTRVPRRDDADEQIEERRSSPSRRVQRNRSNRTRVPRRDDADEQIEERRSSPSRRVQRNRSSKNRQSELSTEISHDRLKRSSEIISSHSSDLQDSLEGSWDGKEVERQWRSGKNESRQKEQDSAGESQYSSWSSDDEYYNVYYSKLRRQPTKTESKPTSRRSSQIQQKPRQQGNSTRKPSPQRERVSSPTRQKSPARRPEGRRREPRAGPIERQGLALTAELLLDQKQKLRPVRPSALPDISGLPEKSLQDLTVLLRRAMNRRRDAFPTSMPSDDQFSDWQTNVTQLQLPRWKKYDSSCINLDSIRS
ncbi:Serine-threonine/tyrosine-protein kinase catalytic domain [Trinorchestia longiramus]|nr:Serine-threonine/tyrosine-protein kinase catalytic domain [Trinorchestia longiramus]